jgi:hypothetical protein
MIIITCEDIERKMDALARKYVETHDPEIIKELLELGRQLRKMESEKPNGDGSVAIKKK